ncbi:MFS transporter [Paraburkholderia sp. GAS199]|uniref:MFS transporter n=1 Tax=Paraburkholderia sp. GAS199 TaxID=3035126 RepID=UPI003D1CA3FA
MIMLDSNIVAVSLPAIARDLNAAFSDIEWVVSAYVLAFAAFLMTAGALSDRFGRKRILITGLVVFTIASVLCGLSPNASTLNLARALQGIGAALQLSAALAVLGHEFRGPDRARAFGFWGTVIGIAIAIGPLVGGLITSVFGWRWAFLVNAPVGIALVILAVRSVHDSRDPEAGRLDIAGMVTFGSALCLLVWAMINGNAAGWSSNATLIKLGVAAGLACLFIAAEILQKRPMVDLNFFRKRTFLGSCVAMLGFASSAQVMMTYLPLYLQNVFGYSPAVAGLGMLPFALPLFFCPRFAASFALRMSGRTLLALGLSIVAIGNLVTSACVISNLPFGCTALGMFLTGCGAGLLNGETAKVSMSVIPPERGGMASGISGTLRFVGLVTGITALGALLAGETERFFSSAAAHTGLPRFTSADTHRIASHIVAGDLAAAIGQVSQPLQATMLTIARASFSSGFAIVMLTAAFVAAAASLLTFLLVSPSETAPSHASQSSETDNLAMID